jgi:hypothetical protein
LYSEVGDDNKVSNAEIATSARYALPLISEDDWEKIAAGSNWIPTLIHSIHNLPVGFVLVNGDLQVIGYPITYLNKYVEKMTGDDNN